MFCGAARTVTGSLYLLEYTAPDKSKCAFILDCGYFQVGQKVNLLKLNSRLLFDPKKLDCIVLTHAHLDHCGRIPYMVRKGFGGRIYSTEATREIAYIVMSDATRHSGEGLVVDLNKESGDFAPAKDDDLYIEARLYSQSDVEQAISRFRTHEYHEPFYIHPNLKVEFYDAGHILGSASVMFTEVSSGKKIVFSGDLGNPHKPIIQDPEIIERQSTLTHIFTETTYGNRLHGKQDPKAKLKDVINDTISSRNGILMIPSFSVERAQEVIYYIVELMQENAIKNVPIYLDSPMASKVLEVCLDHPDLYDDQLREKIVKKANPLIYRSIKILDSVEESKLLNNYKQPCIIIAGSGMLNGGRILKHLQFHIEDAKNTLLFVGYQASGTLGRSIIDGEKEIEVENKMLNVAARIEVINEFSAHADQLMLKKWIFEMTSGNTSNTTVFLMHGEKEASLTLGEELEHMLPKNLKTYWPKFGEKVKLWD